ncbi:hypothetical protein GCM10009836_13930 [Pseudonocardia ailaonensis]|uniref:Uncharacterized protein n=1 Tax=Pseudonocardia ailaonensis TaxID=367279 RepID=A0ABN2MVB4_9PSEU
MLARRGRAAAPLAVALPLAVLASGGSAAAEPLTPAARAAAALGEQASAGAVALRVVLLVGTALLAGIALVSAAGPDAGRRGPGGRAGSGVGPAGSGVGRTARSGRDEPRPRRDHDRLGLTVLSGRGVSVTAWVAAGVVAVAAEVVHLTGSVSVPGTVVHVVAALLAAALVGTCWAALPGAVLVVLLAAGLGSTHSGVAFALDALVAVAVALLLGAAAVGITGRGPAVEPGPPPAPGPGAGEPPAPGRTPVPQGLRSRELAEAVTESFAVVSPAGTREAVRAERHPDSRRATPRPARRESATRAEPAPGSHGVGGRGVEVRGVGDRGAGVRGVGALMGIGLVGGVVAVAAALAQLLVDGPETAHDLTATGAGLAGLSAVVLPALATAGLLALLLHDRRFGASRQVGGGASALERRSSPVRGRAPALAAAGEERSSRGADRRPGAVVAGDRRFGASVQVEGCAAALDRRSSGARRVREVWRIVAVLGVLGTVAAALVGVVPLPGPAPVPGEPLLRTVEAGSQRLALLVAPLRPGPNLVRVSGTGYLAEAAAVRPVAYAGHDHQANSTASVAVTGSSAPAVPFTARDGAAGGWAVVDLPEGASTLTVTAGGVTSTVPVDAGSETRVDTGSATATLPAATKGAVPEGPATEGPVAPGQRSSTQVSAVDGVAGQGADPRSAGLTGPDGPECAAALLGDLVGQRPGEAAPQVTTCPADSLSEADARALRATVRTLTDHGVRSVRIAADDSPRSRAAADLVRGLAAQARARVVDRVDKDSALIVVSGWSPAAATLREAAARSLETPTHLGGTYLAPWLMTAGVVTRATSSIVPLDFDPSDQPARLYAGQVAAAFPGETPSAAGFTAWARHGGAPLADRPRLYGAAPVDVPMTSTGLTNGADDHHHGGANPAAWFPNGTVVPVSAPLETP